jgi:uncharacterized protein
LIDRNIPKIAILGNWEYWGKIDLPKLKKIYEAHGGVLLINECLQLTLKNKQILFTGVDDFLGGHADIQKSTEKYQPSDFHIILNHCPEYSETIQHELQSETPANLILSGHTHGGQINIFGYIPFMPKGSGRFVSGWYTDRQPNIYVSKGIGTSKIPARFGARAEIALFHL